MKVTVAMHAIFKLFLLMTMGTDAALQRPNTYVSDPDLIGGKAKVSHVSCQLACLLIIADISSEPCLPPL